MNLNHIYTIQVIFTSEAKRVLYRKGADIPVDGQLNEGTWILIQICFVDQHGVGPLIGVSLKTLTILQCIWRLTDEWTNSVLLYETDLY